MEKFKIKSTEKSILKSIRLKYNSLEKLEKIAEKNNVSVNKLINECIEYALNNIEDDSNKQNK